MTKDEIEKLILDNMNIAYKLSWKYYKKFRLLVEFEELNGIANLGLVKAANTFNHLKKWLNEIKELINVVNADNVKSYT